MYKIYRDQIIMDRSQISQVGDKINILLSRQIIIMIAYFAYNVTVLCGPLLSGYLYI